MYPIEELGLYGYLFNSSPPKLDKDKEIDRLKNEIFFLKEQLDPKYKLFAAALSDKDLFGEAETRPFFDAWLKGMLGGNKDLDELKAAEKELKKFREALQLKLDQWKIKFNIFISLEEDMRRAEGEGIIPKSVPEIISTFMNQMDRDLVNIFGQIEENLQYHSDTVEKLVCVKEEIRIPQVVEKFTTLPVIVQDESLQDNLKKLKRDLEKEKKERLKVSEDLIQAETRAQNWEDKARDLEVRARRAEAHVKKLQNVEIERENLADALESKEKALARISGSVKAEAHLKQKALIFHEEQGEVFVQNLEIERSKLKLEEKRGLELEMECERLRALLK